MTKRKISYLKMWDKNGCAYDQAIRITEREFNTLNDAISAEIGSNYPRKKEYVFTSCSETYLKPLINVGVVFLNHTQLRFINLFLKEKVKDRNTYLFID